MKDLVQKVVLGGWRLGDCACELNRLIGVIYGLAHVVLATITIIPREFSPTHFIPNVGWNQYEEIEWMATKGRHLVWGRKIGLVFSSVGQAS